MKIEDEYFSIESAVVESIEDFNNVIFNEDMSVCLIGDLTDWKKGLIVVKGNKGQIIDVRGECDKKLVRLIILKERKSRNKVALVVNSILGVVTTPDEGMTLIRQLYKISKARVSNFDITNVFIT